MNLMRTNRKQKLTVALHLFIATIATMISAPAWASAPVESFLSEKDYADL